MRPENRTFIEEARREQIIRCAIEAIATVGYAQASMTRIAKLAKVTAGVISYHFGSKDELIRAVVAHVGQLATELMEPAIVAQSNASDALRVYIELNLEFMRRHPRPLLALVEIVTHGREQYAPQHEIALRDIKRVLEWGKRTGEFREFDPHAMAIAIRGAIDGIPSQLMTNPELELGILTTEFTALFARATRATGGTP